MHALRIIVLQSYFNAKYSAKRCLAHLTQAEVEMQLIERLKQKQMRQRKAYQQLEAVLALGTRWVGRNLGSCR
jgi:hypothetical protein